MSRYVWISASIFDIEGAWNRVLCSHVCTGVLYCHMAGPVGFIYSRFWYCINTFHYEIVHILNLKMTIYLRFWDIIHIGIIMYIIFKWWFGLVFFKNEVLSKFIFSLQRDKKFSNEVQWLFNDQTHETYMPWKY